MEFGPDILQVSLEVKCSWEFQPNELKNYL